MTEHYPLLIPGSKPDASPAEVFAPYDGALIATVDRADQAAVELALQYAYELFRDRDGWLTVGQRVDILERVAAIMQERRDELVLGAAHEGGKPLADSLVETNRAIDSIKQCVHHLRTQAGRAVPMNVNAASAGRVMIGVHEPIGVVVAFSAFNHPINLIAHQVGPAIATGCPVIVKPAANTPLSCMRLVSIFHEAGLPEKWCQAMLTTDRKLTNALASDSRVAFFSFIGSPAVGWMLRSKLAPGTRCALEHGGVAPVIIASDADLESAIPPLTKGGFYHAGQVCVSTQRVFVPREIAEDFGQRLAQASDLLKVGDPLSADTEVGPLIRHAEVDRVGLWVDEAVSAGAKILSGGQAISDSCYAPTVLFDPPADVKVSTQEIFGPVVCVYPYDEIDDAIRLANALPYAFQASVFTSNLDIALRVSHRLDASTVMVNDHTAFRVDWMPFGGLRHSGLGEGGIQHSMHDMQIDKTIIIKSDAI